MRKFVISNIVNNDDAKKVSLIYLFYNSLRVLNFTDSREAQTRFYYLIYRHLELKFGKQVFLWIIKCCSHSCHVVTLRNCILCFLLSSYFWGKPSIMANWVPVFVFVLTCINAHTWTEAIKWLGLVLRDIFILNSVRFQCLYYTLY